MSVPAPTCLNCGAVLTGQYCANCGQRARSRLISLWELLRDAVGDLFELDSRLWRTLTPLTVHPGRLTREYLMGRRARYMPPFRTYLGLSLVFFLVAFFDPGEQFGLLFEPVEPTADAAKREPCEIEDFENLELPEWMARRLTPQRLQEMCERVRADNGRAFLGQLADNIPASLFVLLPLIALVLKVLYPMSKRYYAEHVLFVLHFHAFVFLILTLDVLFSRLARMLSLEFLSGLAGLAVSLYLPVYVYKAMRRVYGQGHAITSVKFLLLVFSYLIGLVLMLFAIVFYTALSI
ncbi:MAG TPA: DUF3667 domain-containing protein [Woeseiaceae bacterium]|jgi:hypothetical protein|nr:DUF3667 domain-containing protein [Woeseiaceae bacterium]